MKLSKKANSFDVFSCRLIATVSIMLISIVVALAQATGGTLRGNATDTNGAAIAGANVTIKNEATGASSTLTTNTEGIFDVPALQPGVYSVTIEAVGFKRAVRTGVNVKLGIVNPLTLILEAGNVAETVTVTSATDEVIQRDQAQISTTIDSRRVVDLPTNGAGSGLDTLALLAPGVIPNRAGGTNTNGTGLSVNGNRGRSNNFQIDGADNNDLSVAGPALFVDFPDSIQEYQVITNNFSAQYGRNQGAIVNIVSKGGGNDFHGSAFWYHQDNKVLNSLNNIEKRSGQKEPNPALYNVFGGTVGGPLFLPRFGEGGRSVISGKDRFFFFFGYQGVRNPSVTTGSSTTLAVLSSEFPRLLATFPGNAVIATIATYSPFAIPGALPNSFVSGSGVPALINTNPATGCPRAIAAGSTPPAGCSGYANLGSFLIGGPYDVINLGTATAPQLFQAAQYQRTLPNAFTENYTTLRFDLRVTQKDNVTVRYLNQKSASQNALALASSGFNGDVPASSKHLGGDWTRTISNSMVNEFRINYQRIGVEFGGGCNTGTPGCIPGPAEIGSALANITFPVALGLTKGVSLATIGPATNLPQGRIGKVYQYADNLSWTRGRHSLIMGAEFKHLTELSPFLPNYNGSYAYNSATRIVNNAPSAVSITAGDPLLLFPENDQYYFIQDDFKIKPNLTLNLGVRYEYTGQPLNVLHDQTVTREGNASTAFFNPSIPVAQRTVPITPADKNNFAPRLGFAWSPHFWKSLFGQNETVIRGGFSIAYDAAFYNILLNVQNAAPFSVALAIPAGSLSSTTSSPSPLPPNPIGDIVRQTAAASGVLPLGVLNPKFLAQTNVAGDFRSPYSEQFSLNIQHQFGRNHVAEIGYVGTHGVGLFQNVNGNFFIGPLVNGFTITRNGVTRTFPGFPNLLPAGTNEVRCTDNLATLDNESACDRRLLAQAGVTTRANTSQSIYHALQARYNGRLLSNSLNISASYTFSKTIDDASEIFAFTGGDILSPNAQNPFCINRCERGRSGLDRPQAFSTSVIYDLPYFHEQRGLMGHLLGGWQINGTYILTSGAVYTPGQTGNGTTLAIGNTYITAGDRPFLTNPNADRRQVGITAIDARLLFPGAPLPPSNGSGDLILYSLNQINANGTYKQISLSDVKYVFNGPGAAQLFHTPFGSAGRGIERGLMFNQLNLGVFKNIKIFETLTLQLRGEAFNLLNHPQPGIGAVVTPGTNHLPIINVNSAGVAGGAFAETGDQILARRVVQVGIRVIF